MTNTLNSFKQFKTDINGLHNVYGVDLHNADIENPEVIMPLDVINAIRYYQTGEITKKNLIDWVNILWFTDLYVYDENCEESISSVMSLLETLDEDGVFFTDDEYSIMIDALNNNIQCEI